MTLFKVDDGMWAHPKFSRVSDSAVALWTRAGSWCCRYLRNGRVEVTDLPVLRGTEAAADELVRVGLWSRLREDVFDGYEFHDWFDLQESKDEVEARRRKQRDSKRDWRRKDKQSRESPKLSTQDSARDSSSDSPQDSLQESRIGTERKISDLSDLSPLPVANTQAERRAQQRTTGDPTPAHVADFLERLRAVCFERDTDAPVLGRKQEADIVGRVMGYAKRRGVTFAEACDEMIAQAFDDVEATGDKLALALGSAEPGKPKGRKSPQPPERELSSYTREALATAAKLKAAGKFF